jgi:hypothetical protein
LERFLGPDSDGAYRAVTAAILNETITAVTCLRRWPDQAAEVLRECSLGALPVVRPGCLGQRLLDNRATGGPPRHVVAIHAVSAAASAVQGRGALAVANVHICGEGCAGKSMTKIALLKTISSSSAIRLVSSELPDIALVDGRTLGLSSTLLDTGGWLKKRVRVVIQDYGGQEAFRVNHAAYLSAPNSVYLLVVPLWDMRPQEGNPSERIDKPMALDYIVDKYRDWLKFINSVVPESARKVQCITVLNFARQFRELPVHKKIYTVEKAVAQLKEVQDVFRASPQCRLEFVEAPPIPVNSIVAASVQKRVVPELWKAIEALQEAPVPMSPIVQAVVNDLQVPGRWPLFCDESELHKRLQAAIRANIRLLVEVTSDPAVKDKVISTVAEITQDRLQARGDIIVFTAQNPTNSTGQLPESQKTLHRISINHPNWLSEQVLGDLFKPDTFTDGAGVRDILLTHERITSVSLPAGASLTPSQRQLIPKLLQHIGACLPVTYADGQFRTIDTDADAGGETPPQHYFPAFNVTRMDGSHAVPWKDPVHVIVRRFKLKDPTTSVLPPGYFPALKVHIVSLYHGSNLIQLYQNGMALEMARGLRVIVRGGADDTSFTLEVEARADRSGECTVSAWEEMLKVRALVVSDAGWLKNVPLNEYGVHPERRQANTRPISELAPLAQAGKLYAEDEPFYFGAGRVDVLNRLKGIVEAGFARMDRKQDRHHDEVVIRLEALTDRVSALCVNTEAAEEALQRAEEMGAASQEQLASLIEVLTAALPAVVPAVTTEGRAVAAVREVAQSLAQHRDQLHSAAQGGFSGAQLQQMKGEIVGEFSRLAESMQRATYEQLRQAEVAQVLRLQQLLDRSREAAVADLEAAMEALRVQQSQAQSAGDASVAVTERLLQVQASLDAARAAQDSDSYGLHEVPLLVEVVAAQPTGTVRDAAKRCLYEVHRLHFCCPACGTRAASGPNKHGYELRSTRGWVQQAARALKVTLFALQVASLVTPLPLPRLAELGELLSVSDAKAVAGALDFVRKQVQGNTTATIGNVRAAMEQLTAAQLQALSVTREHVSSVRALLLKAGESIPPKDTGLAPVVCAGTRECAWVCAWCSGTYRERGNACLAVKISLD